MSRTVYFDTSIIVSCYLRDGGSAEALRLRSQYPEPMPLTEFLRVEIMAAFHGRLFRGAATASDVEYARADFEDDIAQGDFSPCRLSYVEVLERAERLARDWIPTLGISTLDIIHVACALELSATHFMTADLRQSAFARALGLEVDVPRVREG